MPSFYLDKGKWKEKTTSVWSKDNKKWNDLVNRYHKIDGKWYPIYKYEWKVGNWGSCSKVCDTGTQTRTVDCYRNGTKITNKSLCTKALNDTPISSQNCNTHSCLLNLPVQLSADDYCILLGQVDNNNYNNVVVSNNTQIGNYWTSTSTTLNLNLNWSYNGYVYYKVKVVDLHGSVIGIRIQGPSGCAEQVQGALIKGRASGSWNHGTWVNDDCWYHKSVRLYEQQEVILKIPVPIPIA